VGALDEHHEEPAAAGGQGLDTGRVAGVAQLVERLLAMQKVAGSSPVARSGAGPGRLREGRAGAGNDGGL
jgi:hypothetical protein